ncbi:MAG: hypothetical protein NVS9B4_00140 [Candidatus Acidiferrum sp.]
MTAPPLIESLFTSIGDLVPPERRTRYYEVMAHLRNVEPHDEMLRVLEAMGFLALIVGEVPARIEAALDGAGLSEREELVRRIREVSQAAKEFASAVQSLTDPNTGAAAQVTASLDRMQGDLRNAEAHVRSLVTALRVEWRGAMAFCVGMAMVVGVLGGWLFAHL